MTPVDRCKLVLLTFYIITISFLFICLYNHAVKKIDTACIKYV